MALWPIVSDDPSSRFHFLSEEELRKFSVARLILAMNLRG